MPCWPWSPTRPTTPTGWPIPNVTAEEQSDFVDSVKDHEGFAPLTPIATEERFPPGSTFKVVTSTAVYNLKPSLINYSFPEASSISFTDSNKILSTTAGGACGGTMALMLPRRATRATGCWASRSGVPTLTQQAQDFGYAIYGANSHYVPNIDLPGVIPSTFSQLLPDAQALPGLQRHRPVQRPRHRPAEALVAAGIANGGVIMTPHLMRRSATPRATW